MTDTTLSGLLELAAHDNTPPTEAVAALQAAKRRLGLQGKTLRDLAIQTASGSAPPYRPMFARSIKTELEELRAESADQKKELAKARKEIARLNDQLVRNGGKRIPKNDDGSMAFEPFSAAVTARLGKSHGWKRIFAQKFGLPSESTLATWAKQDCVPREAVEFLKKLTPESKRTAPAKKPWNDYEHKRAAELVTQGRSDRDMAKILTEEFGRTITLGAAKKARQRIRQRDEARASNR